MLVNSYCQQFHIFRAILNRWFHLFLQSPSQTVVVTIQIIQNLAFLSFTMNTESHKCRSNVFHIKNCESLKSIEIDVFSFSDSSKRFELKNLPSLQSIKIGTVGSKSYNFYRSSFIIRGIDMIWLCWMIRSSKSKIHYIGWSSVLWFPIDNNRKYWPWFRM